MRYVQTNDHVLCFLTLLIFLFTEFCFERVIGVLLNLLLDDLLLVS